MKILENVKNYKTKCKCMDDDGYLYYLSKSDLSDKRTKKNKRFGVNNPYSMDNFVHYFKLNNYNVEPISKEYIATKNGNMFWRCKCGKIFERSAYLILNSSMPYCKECIIQKQSEDKTFTLENVKKILSKYQLKMLNNIYINSKTPISIEDKDGYRGEQALSQIQENKHFLKYDKKNPYYYYNIQHFLELNGYNCHVVQKEQNSYNLEIICECGNHYNALKNEIVNSKPRWRCKTCSSSISNGEIAVAKWLDAHNILYKTQYRFKDCKYKRMLPFDFYIESLNMCIEFDGIFHYKKQPNITEKQFVEQQIRDKIKNEYCKNNGIKLIRIPFWFLYNKKYKKILEDNILV